jgi:LuxR family maltose regulon positive regulatory protein
MIAKYGGSVLLPVVTTVPPKFRRDWVEPPALRRGIEFLRSHRFLLITALAGSGKSRFMTRLLSDAQAALDITCWLSCGYCAPGTLGTGVATAIVRSVLGERSATAAMLMAPGVVPSSVLLTVCINEIAAFSGEVVLFLDDIGASNDDGDWETLQRLIDEAPENLRIVMATRSAVRLKLAKLLNDGELVRLASRDFYLAADQIAELIAGAGQPRPELAELRTLSERTLGWVGGIRLLTRRDYGRRQGGAAFTVGTAVLDYFEEEVLDRLSDDARGALDTILLPHVLREALLIELVGEAGTREHLAELEAHGLITKLHADAAVLYQAAPLLAEVARQRRLLSDTEAQDLHRRCSVWFEQHGEPQAAAAHAIDSGDLERAILLIDHCGMAMIANGQVTALQQWMPQLPLDILRRRPRALLAVAWALSLLYRLDEALPLLAALEQDLGPRGGDSDDMLHASIGALRIMHFSMRDDVLRARDESRAWIACFGRRDDWPTYVVDNSLSFALAHLGEVHEAKLVLERAYLPNFYAQGPYAAIYSRSILGLIDLRAGQVRRAEANFAWALKAAEADADANSTGAVMAAGLLAGARHERNDLQGARRLVDGYAWWMHGHLFTDARFQAYRAIARDQMQRRQYRAAISTLEQVLDAGPAVRLTRLHADVLVEKVQVALAQHDLRMANTYIRALADQRRNVVDDAFLYAYLDASVLGSQAHLDLELGAYDEAATFLARAIRVDLKGGWGLRAFHWAMLLVRALWRSDRQREATRIMDRLVGYAAGAGIVSTILDGGADIAQVLERVARTTTTPEARKHRHLRLLREALDPSLVEVPDDHEVDPANAGEALTTREMELIRLVRGGLTNRQIAARMQVSENTIKWHLKNIFEKVSVKKRAELAGIALPHGLTPPPAGPPAKRVVPPSRPSASLISAMRDT